MVLVVKKPSTNARDAKDTVSIPGLGRFPRIGNGNPLQYSSWKNSTDRGAFPAWKIPQTEEPGGLQSLGLQRFRHG